MPHSKRDIRKYRGSRTHGYGRVGQHRKGGQRGGKGKAGLHKGGWTWTVKFDRYHFGKYGFKRPPRIISHARIINLGQLEIVIDKLLAQKIAKQDGNKISVNLLELGITKVLGSGKISRPLIITAPSFSKIAIKKIEDAGGSALGPNT
ncbi:MAG: 50S ribosomal protein L15 [Candidatus Helarchaeota archaeon]|nr:50S ribosomal protein L15 [Candidatus Helarchaeota archaeon]